MDCFVKVLKYLAISGHMLKVIVYGMPDRVHKHSKGGSFKNLYVLYYKLVTMA